MNKSLRLLTGVILIPLALAGCNGGGNDAGSAKGEISYWLWDSNQQPAYTQCATAFTAKNPDITVKITQRGWDDYWSTLTTAFAADTAPDVFTDHLSKFAEFADKKLLLPLDDAVSKDGIKTDIYAKGLPDLWVGPDGKRYGLPKDWDTIALFYNKKMATDAGITAEQMKSLTWNPQDGGTYEKAIAHLTVDKNGKRGDEPGFDKNNVKVYGLGLDQSYGAAGQFQWSMYSGTTGWTHTDKNPWGTRFNYDDPRFQATITWWAGLIGKGYMPKLETTVGANPSGNMTDAFAASKSAINAEGSWTLSTYTGFKGLDVGIAPTPIGPSGKRASMFNGLADSIWAGSKKQAAATKWVEFLASPACQDIVAKQAVVFPAITTSTDFAQQSFSSKGIDVTPFTNHVKDATTFLVPITAHDADIAAIMTPAMDAVLSGKADASSLTEANTKVNALLK
jgi:multiple sugar transport system substrate-binding protein